MLLGHLLSILIRHTQEVAMSKVVHRDIVLHVNAARAVNSDAPAEGVPDGVRSDKGVLPVRVHVQGHVVVHRIGGQHEHLWAKMNYIYRVGIRVVSSTLTLAFEQVSSKFEQVQASFDSGVHIP